MAIGGKGLPMEAEFRQDLPDAGLTNVTGAIMNLLGFQACLLPCVRMEHTTANDWMIQGCGVVEVLLELVAVCHLRRAAEHCQCRVVGDRLWRPKVVADVHHDGVCHLCRPQSTWNPAFWSSDAIWTGDASGRQSTLQQAGVRQS